MLYVQFWQQEPMELRAQAQVTCCKTVGFQHGNADVADVLRRFETLVVMSYLKTASVVVFNQPEIYKMQPLLDALKQNTIAVTDTTLPRVFVGPGATAPDDGRFDYVLVSDLRGLVAATKEPKPNTIIMLDLPESILEIFVRENKAFGVTPVVVTGLPQADYTAAFNMRTFDFPKASYVEMLEALATEDVDSATAARADKTEAGRSARRETKHEDGGGRFAKFEMSHFAPMGKHNAVAKAFERRSSPTVEEDLDIGADNE